MRPRTRQDLARFRGLAVLGIAAMLMVVALLLSRDSFGRANVLIGLIAGGYIGAMFAAVAMSQWILRDIEAYERERSR